MKITNRNIDELIPYERNQKKHDEKQIANVANSIKRFGWQTVDCVVADDLTENEIRELRIVDNKTNESPWDFDMQVKQGRQRLSQGWFPGSSVAGH